MKCYYGTMRRLVVASLLVLGAGACDKIISSDVATIAFDLPPRHYTFNASMAGVPSALAQEVPCGAPPVMDCCNPTPPLPAPDCSANPITCEQNENGTNVCMAQATISQSQMMNLGMEVSQLSGLTGVVTISIKRIGYQVNSNTLDVDLPDVSLYLAPAGVTDASDPNAQKFGTMPAISAGSTPTGDVVLEPNAKQVLASFTSNLQSPFNFIATTTLKVSHAPTGAIDMTINGQLSASP